ncbi:unnamed protein product [Dimorphilus gyrociliatus]|uniref:Uncharacterized protein n=1 Tax=Dimorphilus gyrociliatus TaxID=2664684 RepID=A0A7I8W9T5_9ANNE|nr:unnamed protein product [Dimorphilus gyrociliatus]
MKAFRVLLFHIIVCLRLIFSQTTLQTTYTPLSNKTNSTTLLLSSQNGTIVNTSKPATTASMASYGETKGDFSQSQAVGKTQLTINEVKTFTTTSSKLILKSSTDRSLSAIPNRSQELFSRTPEMTQARTTLGGTKDNITTGNDFLTNSTSVFTSSFSKNASLTSNGTKSSQSGDINVSSNQSSPTTASLQSLVNTETHTAKKIDSTTTEAFGTSRLDTSKLLTTATQENESFSTSTEQYTPEKIESTSGKFETKHLSTSKITTQRSDSTSIKEFETRTPSTLKALITTQYDETTSAKEFGTTPLSPLKALLTTQNDVLSSTTTEQQTSEKPESTSATSQLSTLQKIIMPASESSLIASTNSQKSTVHLRHSSKVLFLTTSANELKNNLTVTDLYNRSANFNSNDDSDSSNKAWIAAIVIGVVFIMVVIVLLAKLFCQFRESTEPVVLLSEIPIRTSFIGKRTNPDGFAVPYISTSESETQGGTVNIAFTQENGDNDSNRSSPPPYSNHKSVFMV